jgi:hypothetical protein
MRHVKSAMPNLRQNRQIASSARAAILRTTGKKEQRTPGIGWTFEADEPRMDALKQPA